MRKSEKRISFLCSFSENLSFLSLLLIGKTSSFSRHNTTKATRALLLQNIPLTPLLLSSHRFAHQHQRTLARAHRHTHTNVSLSHLSLSLSLSLVEQQTKQSLVRANWFVEKK
jgi:hypothetical protein